MPKHPKVFRGKEPEKKFTRIPNYAISDTELSDRDYRVYSYLLHNRNGWNLVVSNLADDLKKSRATIYAALDSLTKLGYITKKKDDYGNDIYILN